MSTIPGLAVWVMASENIITDGDGGVSVWGDKSGGGHDLASTGSTNPRLDPTGIAGQPSVHMSVASTVSSTSFTAAFQAWQDSEFLLAEVIREPAGSSGGYLIDSSGVSQAGARFMCFAGPTFQNGSFTLYGTTACNDGAPKLVVARRKYPPLVDAGIPRVLSYEVRMNGALQASLTSDKDIFLEMAGPGATFGRQQDGDIAEIVVAIGAGAGSDASTFGLESYLKAKYGF